MKVYLVRQNDGIVAIYKTLDSENKLMVEYNKKTTTEKLNYYYIREMELEE
jgi:hypothetical protein